MTTRLHEECHGLQLSQANFDLEFEFDALEFNFLLEPGVGEAPFMVILDEFAYYCAPNLASLSAGARSFGSESVIATQSLADFGPSIVKVFRGLLSSAMSPHSKV